MNQAERNLLKYLQGVNETPQADKPLSDTEIVAAFVALQDEYADSRTRAITSLRLFAEPEDYDLVMAAGDLGGAEPNLWEYGL